ncbi:hypothetical protein X801_07729, partial [Opisthorchis viverrini]
VVKLSPGHSQVDWECAKTHGLPILNMLDSSGKVTNLGGEFAAAESGLIKFHPSYQKDVWSEWLSPGKHRDWCISRQLWWGHPIPAYRSKKTDPAKDETTGWVIARSMTEAEKQLSVESSRIEQAERHRQLEESAFASSWSVRDKCLD